MHKINSYIAALFGVVVLFSSCKKEYETVEQLDNKTISDYKKTSALTFVDDPTGYSYSIVNAGSGSAVAYTDSVYYHYKFKKLNGTVLNETNDLMRPGTYLGYTDQFTISNAAYSLKPIREVLKQLKRGGSAVLLLPSRLAFGKNGAATFNIGSNETLLVELGLYEQAKRHEVDLYEINKFISNNNLSLTTDVSGVRYNVSTVGTGTDDINSNSTIVVTYTGRYLDGTVFDSGTDISFKLSDLIKGWQIVIPGKIKAGGKIRLIIPSHLAYNQRPLDFDIEVTKVTND